MNSSFSSLGANVVENNVNFLDIVASCKYELTKYVSSKHASMPLKQIRLNILCRMSA